MDIWAKDMVPLAIFGLGGPEMIALLMRGFCFLFVSAAVIVLIVSLTGKNSKRMAALEEEYRRLREEIKGLTRDHV